jgi:hypothetical protein
MYIYVEVHWIVSGGNIAGQIVLLDGVEKSGLMRCKLCKAMST